MFYATESFTLPLIQTLFNFCPFHRCFLSPFYFIKHIFSKETRIVCGLKPWNSSICSYAVEYTVCTEVLMIQKMYNFPLLSVEEDIF